MKNDFGKISRLEVVSQYFFDGMTLMFGGFGGVGSPPTMIEEILRKGVSNLTLIGNDTGFPEIGIGKIVSRGRAKKGHCFSYRFKSDSRKINDGGKAGNRIFAPRYSCRKN